MKAKNIDFRTRGNGYWSVVERFLAAVKMIKHMKETGTFEKCESGRFLNPFLSWVEENDEFVKSVESAFTEKHSEKFGRRTPESLCNTDEIVGRCEDFVYFCYDINCENFKKNLKSDGWEKERIMSMEMYIDRDEALAQVARALVEDSVAQLLAKQNYDWGLAFSDVINSSSATTAINKLKKVVLNIRAQNIMQGSQNSIGWISVNERMPEERVTHLYHDCGGNRREDWVHSDRVLAVAMAAKEHSIDVCRRSIRIMHTENGQWHYNERDKVGEECTVTHWMPLPEFPDVALLNSQIENNEA